MKRKRLTGGIFYYISWQRINVILIFYATYSCFFPCSPTRSSADDDDDGVEQSVVMSIFINMLGHLFHFFYSIWPPSTLWLLPLEHGLGTVSLQLNRLSLRSLSIYSLLWSHHFPLLGLCFYWRCCQKGDPRCDMEEKTDLISLIGCGEINSLFGGPIRCWVVLLY